MATPLDSVHHMTVTAIDIDEAVEFVVAQLQSMCAERSARGFTLPSCTQESFELVNGEWSRVYEFSAEFLPEVK